MLPKLTDVYDDGVITFTDLNNPVNQGPGKIVDTNGDGVITAADVLAPTSAGGWASGSTQDGDTSTPDDLIGWNFVNNNNNPLDGNGHGTVTAGEIGAVGNNGIGVTGVEWNAQIMPVQVARLVGLGDRRRRRRGDRLRGPARRQGHQRQLGRDRAGPDHRRRDPVRRLATG